MGPEGIPLKPGSHQVGEVQCRGPTVFQGYWQLPQASQEAFTEDGWFCTGDLATINTAGYITVVDRIKDMILHGQYFALSTDSFGIVSRLYSSFYGLLWYHLKGVLLAESLELLCE